MRGYKILQLIFCFITLSAIELSEQIYCQMPRRGGNQIAVTGWADDTHYLFRSFDENKNLVTRSFDVKTGKGTSYSPEASGRELIATLLPEGTTLSMNDVLSPDSKSIIIVKDNDLFLFRASDKSMKRLTNDKTPEVNTRFSPHGTRIAYTKTRIFIYMIS
ncbi:MAG: PD40 domain-containing protein [Bacteroidales bacterium]|nr:PD40 domain-containing protein [Bacteroidales bacterium]